MRSLHTLVAEQSQVRQAVRPTLVAALFTLRISWEASSSRARVVASPLEVMRMGNAFKNQSSILKLSPGVLTSEKEY